MTKLSYQPTEPCYLQIERDDVIRILPVTQPELDVKHSAAEWRIATVLATLHAEFDITLTERQLFLFLKWGEITIE